MIHQDNPAIQQIHKARLNGLLPCCLQVKQLTINTYTLVDQEGVTYGNFDSYAAAAKAKTLAEKT